VRQVSPTLGQASPTLGQASPTLGQVSPTLLEVSPTLRGANPTPREANPTLRQCLLNVSRETIGSCAVQEGTNQATPLCGCTLPGFGSTPGNSSAIDVCAPDD